MYKVKDQVKKSYGDSKTVLQNLDRLIESVSLIVVAVFSYLVVRGKIDATHLSTFSKYAILGSAIVIAMRGAYESLRFLSK